MKTYCTQNNGDCLTCSLVTYRHDCRNHRVVTCSKCGALIDTVTFDNLFGEPKTNGPALCDDCYAEERRGGFVGPLEPYRGEPVEDSILRRDK
jgi:hypothetical protein